MKSHVWPLFSTLTHCAYTVQVYEQLKNRVASPAFLDSLKLSLADGASTSSDNTLLKTEGIDRKPKLLW